MFLSLKSYPKISGKSVKKNEPPPFQTAKNLQTPTASTSKREQILSSH
jgi:hypothetical protein